MYLQHATPRWNLASIRRTGLETDRATGTWRAVWLHTPSQTDWAIQHTAERHGCRPDDIVIIRVKVSRRTVRRFRQGIWYSFSDVAPDRLALTGRAARVECPF